MKISADTLEAQKDSAIEETCQTQEHSGQQRNGIDQGSSLLDTAINESKAPQIANRAQEQSEGDILLADGIGEEHGQDLNSTQNSMRPIWRRDRDIYRARLIKSFIWLSQINASCTIVVVCALYLVLQPGNTLLFWVVVGGCVAGWLIVTVLWYGGGMLFSRLFDVQGLLGVEESTTTPLGSPQGSPRRDVVGLE